MTDAERQARHRAARAAGIPITRARRTVDQRSRARRWHDAVAELTQLQAQYAVWLAALPTNLQDSTTAKALQVICDLDLAELQAVHPRGDLAGTDRSAPQALLASRRPGQNRRRALPSKCRQASAGVRRRSMSTPAHRSIPSPASTGLQPNKET